MKTKMATTILLTMFLAFTMFSVAPVHANAVPSIVWLPPLSNQEVFQLKDGSTVPIKFTLLSPEGSFVRDESVKVAVNEVLLRDDFNDGNADDWTQINYAGTGGIWAVEDEEYSLDSLSGGTVAISTRGDFAWTDYSVQVSVKKISGTQWPDVFFRYQDVGTFYYVQLRTNGLGLGKRVSNSYTWPMEWWSGAVDLSTWHVVKIVGISGSIKVYLDGVERIDVTDTSISTGVAGVGAWYSHVHFDDVLVLKANPIETFTYGEGDDNVRIYGDEGAYTLFSDDFESYAGTDASPTWTVASGTWLIEDENGNKVYSGSNPTGPGGFAISSLTLGTGPMVIETDFVEQGDSPWQNGLILFDYNGPDDFKAAGAAVGADQWRIQHYDGSWHIDAELSETIDTLTPYHLKVVIEGNTVTLYVNNVEKLAYTFTSIGTGKIGLFSVNAHAHFDNYSVKVGYYIANLHTKELEMESGKEYAITVWYQGTMPIKDMYIFEYVDSVQGTGRGKGRA